MFKRIFFFFFLSFFFLFFFFWVCLWGTDNTVSLNYDSGVFVLVTHLWRKLLFSKILIIPVVNDFRSLLFIGFGTVTTSFWKHETLVSTVVVHWKTLGLLLGNKSIQEYFQGFCSRLALWKGFFKLQISQKSFKLSFKNSELKSPKRRVLA